MRRLCRATAGAVATAFVIGTVLGGGLGLVLGLYKRVRLATEPLIVALIQWLSLGTALTFAFAVGTGVAAGARDVREGRGLLDDGRL